MAGSVVLFNFIFEYNHHLGLDHVQTFKTNTRVVLDFSAVERLRNASGSRACVGCVGRCGPCAVRALARVSVLCVVS